MFNTQPPDLQLAQAEEPARIVHRPPADQATRRGIAPRRVAEELPDTRGVGAVPRRVGLRALYLGGASVVAQVGRDRGV